MINYSIPGWMSGPELMWLHETSKKMKSVLEIGSFKGRSTFALCTGCQGTVFAVDRFEGDPTVFGGVNFYKDFYTNVGHFTNLVIFRADSVYASQFFAPKSIDMIFIDGDHTKEGVIADIDAWLPKCNKLICGHDLRPWAGKEWTKGESEVEPALRDRNIDFRIAVDSIWYKEL